MTVHQFGREADVVRNDGPHALFVQLFVLVPLNRTRIPQEAKSVCQKG